MQNESSPYSFTCDHCHHRYNLFAQQVPAFCPFCGQPSSCMEPIQAIGAYQLMHSIGKGGMGEVFLAFDTSCGRKIALKQIRSDLVTHPHIRRRFLREARMTCQLTHPAIIPIYAIHEDDTSVYYTMPFVEGETLKQIIRRTRQQEKQGVTLDHLGGSIPALMRIFMTICQAVAFAHSRGILHRDLKPENIIIGKYGEVLILDWGLAKPIEETEEEFSLSIPSTDRTITHIGKVVGTIAYMAPERAFGHPSTVQTDIYSLGVILYQLLALRPPFKRGKTVEEFKKTVKREEWIDPIILAPHRDVPRILSHITAKCMMVDIHQRYPSVDALIHDLEDYMEGRSDWLETAQLDIQNKHDWEFQENVFIAEHIAITQIAEESEWVSLMVSRASFPGNIRIETDVYLGTANNGIGFLLNIPEASERQRLNDGYCLWLSSDLHRSTKLLRSTVEVMLAPDIFLKRDRWYHVCIEKVEETLHIYIDHTLQFSYTSYIPLIGTHVGLLARDADFEIKPLQLAVGSLNLVVNCLAIPDAFLAHRDFSKALSEYRRLAYSFPDRKEGREALFRAGLTLIEQAKEVNQPQFLLEEALKEFAKLHGTPSAPLEYLGKSLVYRWTGESEEEVKCFELAYRRYPLHPLLPILQEQILSRMHELARQQRIAAYRFILLAVQHLPSTTDIHTRKLFTSVQKHWEILPFIKESLHVNKDRHFALQLAFWLAKPYVLEEIMHQIQEQTTPSKIEMGNCLFALLELGCHSYIHTIFAQIKHLLEPLTSLSLQHALACHTTPLDVVFQSIVSETLLETRALTYCMDRALDTRHVQLIDILMNHIKNAFISAEDLLLLNSRHILAHLLAKNWQQARKLMDAYSIELMHRDTTILHFLYGCWLQATEGTDIALVHLNGITENSYPRSWTLASHYLTHQWNTKNSWLQRAFLWEKRTLYQQLALYFHCAGDEDQGIYFENLYRNEFMNITEG